MAAGARAIRAAALKAPWATAVEVAREEGVYATARAVRCDSSRLKTRMSMALSAGSTHPTRPTAGTPTKAPPAFVA